MENLVSQSKQRECYDANGNNEKRSESEIDKSETDATEVYLIYDDIRGNVKHCEIIFL